MSAGGLSYSGIVNYGKVTLPSVESWGTNMNILRDPPKSITTRRINRVGETSSITEMIDQSGNRSCEAINVYARGVNPFVSVSYSNYGNNGGQRSGGLKAGGVASAKLPYRVMRDGAFRPPVLLQEDLLPLSRMPRIWTSAFTKPGFPDFSRKMITCGNAKNTKEVRTDILHTHVRPTATYNLEKPISEPFEVKYVIQPAIKTAVTSGMRSMDITQVKDVPIPTKEIQGDPLHAHVQSNIVTNVKLDRHTFNTDPYIQETNQHQVMTNISSHKGVTSIDDVVDLSHIPIKDHAIRIQAESRLRGPDRIDYLHDDIRLIRTLPHHTATTNVANPSIYKRQEHTNPILSRNIPSGSFVSNPVARGTSNSGSRQVRLAPKIQPGSYSVPVNIPTVTTHVVSDTFESEKARLGRKVMESMQGRYGRSMRRTW